jgi:hypothetical protein
MAGLKVYELTTQGTLIATDWLVIQRGTDPAKKINITGLFANPVITGNASILGNLGVKNPTPLFPIDNKTGFSRTDTTPRTISFESTTDLDDFSFGLRTAITGAASESLRAVSVSTDTYNKLTEVFTGSTSPIILQGGGGSVGIGITPTSKLHVSGVVTATGFVPFTGCHIAKSNEDLKLGELVQIKSIGWVNSKQPDWIAEYCNGSKKGVYGVVYDTQINEDEELIYLIACVGDGFIEVDCACEYGDILIPSETKGLATVYKGDYVPLNSVGFAGEDSEGGKIAWTKE